jgi:hypothetical protein
LVLFSGRNLPGLNAENFCPNRSNLRPSSPNPFDGKDIFCEPGIVLVVTGAADAGRSVSAGTLTVFFEAGAADLAAFGALVAAEGRSVNSVTSAFFLSVNEPVFLEFFVFLEFNVFAILMPYQSSF